MMGGKMINDQLKSMLNIEKQVMFKQPDFKYKRNTKNASFNDGVQACKEALSRVRLSEEKIHKILWDHNLVTWQKDDMALAKAICKADVLEVE